MIDVIVVEDFPLMRDALAAGLASDPRIRVRAAVGDGRALLDELVVYTPDIVLMDLHLPGLDGPGLIERVLRIHPSLRIVVLSACEKPGPVMAALRAGARGYLVKRQPLEQVIDGVVAAADGGAVLAPQVAGSMFAVAPDGGPMPARLLEPIDLQIVAALARGETDQQIATSLFVSTRTVQNHLSRIRSVAGVTRRTELARWAWDNQLV
jgi:DNA-binding NarL/FixJ family response regulator